MAASIELRMRELAPHRRQFFGTLSDAVDDSQEITPYARQTAMWATLLRWRSIRVCAAWLVHADPCARRAGDDEVPPQPHQRQETPFAAPETTGRCWRRARLYGGGY